MEKVQKTYRFDKEVIKHSEKNPLIRSFAEWASESYRKEFLGLESKQKRIKELENILSLLRSEVKEYNKTQKKILTPGQRKWLLQEGIPNSKKFTFEGVYKQFCHTFNRDDLNRRQFKLLLDGLEENGNPKKIK